MSPAPRRKHQMLVGELYAQLNDHLADKTCETIVSPIDEGVREYRLVNPNTLEVTAYRRTPDGDRYGLPVVESLADGLAVSIFEGLRLIYAAAEGASYCSSC